MSIVGQNIRHFRKRLALSQEDMAIELCVTRQTISNWETGKAFPDIDMLKRIATTLNVSVDYLIYDPAERKSSRFVDAVSLKPVLLTPIIFFLLLTFGSSLFIPIFEKTVGGGVAETYLYPIYFGLILLATLIVLCTCIVVDEIRRIRIRSEEEDAS